MEKGEGRSRKGSADFSGFGIKKTIRLWFDMWLYQKDMGIDDIFTEDVLYTESWCPQYSNRKTIKHWFQEWNTHGKVVIWEIRQYLTEVIKMYNAK